MGRKYPFELWNAILDAIDSLTARTGRRFFHWKTIRREIHRQTGYWVTDTTLVRTLRKMREKGVLSGNRGWWGRAGTGTWWIRYVKEEQLKG